MRCEEIMDFPYDPWMILGVAKDGDDEDVQAAWKRAGSPDFGGCL
jgi:preprotein translocase subunit Sec63